ncbi:LIM and calponin homology domains-containing protein 1 isoform X9 [Lithobates pipiens]
MASPALDVEEISPESPPEVACTEAQKWIERLEQYLKTLGQHTQVTGRSFGDKDFRTGLENGILLCELLNAIKPGLIKKINRLPTPIAGLDNVALFLRGCKELGLKESQLFDPGDLQDTSNRTVRISDCNRKLRNVLVTVYWLGKAANSCASYSGNHLDLKEFEGLLAQMRKENEEVESPKRSIRDSGYIDCWDSERSDSLSPPRHGRDDSFDSLDSFGSRSQQTPSPDVVLRGSSDGRGSDSESDQPHKRLPDVRKDDMSARRVSFGENKIIVPFNQYLPNKGNQTSYLPAPLRKKRVEHDYRKSWSTATSPLGGERPFSPNYPGAIEEEHGEGQNGEDGASSLIKGQLGITEKCKEYFDQQEDDVKEQPLVGEDEEGRKLKRLQKVGIKVMPAAKRYSRSKDIFPEVTADMKPNLNDKTETNAVQLNSAEDACKEDTSLQKDRSTPDPEKDDMMVRRISVSQRPPGVTLTHFLPVPFSLQKTEEKSQILQPKEKPPISSVFMTTLTPNNAPQALTTVRSDSPSKTLQQSAAEEPTELRDDSMCQSACNPIENNPICAELKSQPPQETFESPDREVPRFSTQSSLSDDTESVSMCDMRYEDEGCMLPHSRAHHEHLQFVNDLLKEEDDTWQDDLARWKTRRRSASQDLLKKEEERKKMERLLSGEPDLSERRKSIKTYKEIVEEKERREKELHEAYKNARTREEAEKILQKYIERFTISEAVLERLVMPKILERSHSVEPGLLSSSEDPNPLKYLRQQSMPSPKFTSTVEATISPTSELDFKAPMGPPISPTKNVVSKAVPMLTPKPYSQPRNTQHVLKTFKIEGKASMNGEAMNGTEEHKEIGSSGVQMFSPSLTRSQMFEGVARVDAPAAVLKPDASSIELNLKRPNAQNSTKDKILSDERNHSDVVDGTHSSLPTNVHNEQTAEGTTQHNKENSIVTSLESTPPLAPPEAVVNGKDQEEEQKVDPKSLSLDFSIKKGKETALHQVKATQDDGQEPLWKEQHGDPESSGNSAVPIPALNSPTRFCSWDPEEERRRQERWQQEQERLLQEKYQKEQEKLKEEWQKAQKEVEEEERKYYEEERKIIEDTLMPLTVSPATSLHHGVCEMNGSTTPSHREQETTSEETWTEAKSCVKEAAQPEDNKPQVPLWTLEGALNRPEVQNNGSGRLETEEMVAVTYDNNYGHQQQGNTPTSLHLQFGVTLESHVAEDVESLNNFVDSKSSQPRSPCVDSKGLDPLENPRDIINSSQSTPSQGQSPNRYKRSVSGKKLCSTCGIPLGKGAAMIIETLSLYFHIQCFKCGICKGQLGDATTGTDVRIRNGLLNCNDCYIRSRTAGHPTPL